MLLHATDAQNTHVLYVPILCAVMAGLEGALCLPFRPAAPFFFCEGGGVDLGSIDCSPMRDENIHDIVTVVHVVACYIQIHKIHMYCTYPSCVLSWLGLRGLSVCLSVQLHLFSSARVEVSI